MLRHASVPCGETGTGTPQTGTQAPETEESLFEIVINQILVLKATIVFLNVISKLTTVLVSNYSGLIATFFLP